MRKALAFVLVLLALGAGGAWLFFNYLDVLVEAALERYGPEVTGVTVQVDEVRISPRSGRGAIRGLEVGSPAGFTAPRTARLGEIRVTLDPATLTDRVVRIRELVIDSPQVTYEHGRRGTNLEAIQRSIEAYVRRSGGGGNGAAASDKRRYVIDRLAIRNTRVLMTNPALRGQGVSFELPAVELRDVGRRQGGVTAGEAAGLVAGAFQQRIAQRLLSNAELLRRGGLEGATEALKGLLRR